MIRIDLSIKRIMTSDRIQHNGARECTNGLLTVLFQCSYGNKHMSSDHPPLRMLESHQEGLQFLGSQGLSFTFHWRVITLIWKFVMKIAKRDLKGEKIAKYVQ